VHILIFPHICRPAIIQSSEWVVTFEHGVSIRSVKNFESRAPGKGPSKGAVVVSETAPSEGSDGNYYVACKVNASILMYLPVLNVRPDGKGFENILEPADKVNFGAKDTFVITHPTGVSYRQSTCSDDRYPDGRMVHPNSTLQGHSVTGIDGVIYVRVAPRQYLPMTAKGDLNTVYIRKQQPAPQPSGYGAYQPQQPSGYGAPGSGYGAPGSGYQPNPSPYGQPSGYGAPGSGYGLQPTPSGYPAPSPYGAAMGGAAMGAAAYGGYGGGVPPPPPAPPAPKTSWTKYDHNGRCVSGFLCLS